MLRGRDEDCFLTANKSEFLPLRFLVSFWTYAWPVTLKVNLVAAATRRTKLVITSLYFLILCALGTIALARSPTPTWAELEEIPTQELVAPSRNRGLP